MFITGSRKVEISEIPVVDLSLLDGSDRDRARLFQEVRDACETVGFFYIKNHGVGSAATDSIFEQCRRFFAIPQAEREALHLTKSPVYRGYLSIGERGANLERPADVLEAFNLGIDLGPDDPDVRAGTPLHGPNQWPSSLPGFREAVGAYQEVMGDLARRLLCTVAGALDMKSEKLAALFERYMAQLRLLHYPPQPPQIDNMMGARPHRDTSFITILLQDDIGGLEVEARNGDWLMAPPRPDMFVINCGGYLETLSGGTFTAAKHRVVNRSGKERYSIPYFISPSFETTVHPLATLASRPNARSLPPVHVGHDMANFFHSLWPSVRA